MLAYGLEAFIFASTVNLGKTCPAQPFMSGGHELSEPSITVKAF